jgi:hypothetical protein
MSQRVGHPQLDEGLTRDADASGFSIDRAQQVDGEVDVDALNPFMAIFHHGTRDYA